MTGKNPDAEKWLALIANHASDIVILLNADGKIVWTSRPVDFWSTVPAETVLGSAPWELIHPDDRAVAAEGLGRIVSDGSIQEPVRFRLRSGDEQYRWVSALGQRLTDPTLPGDAVVTFRDVDDDMRTRLALDASEARFRMLAENASDVVYIIDNTGAITWVSPSVTEILGYAPDELIGRKVRDLVHPDDVRINEVRPHEAVKAGLDRGQATLRFRDAEGAWRWIGLTGRAVRDSSGEVVGGIESLRDMSAEVAVRRELEHAASHDPLTGLPNRTALIAELERTLRSNAVDGGCTAVVMLDLDHFKGVNDTLGHAAGDQLLCVAADRILHGVRSSDFVARQGGDEFVVVMHDVSGWQQAADAATRLVNSFHEPTTISGASVPSTISAGVSLGCGGVDPDRLLADADGALYRAKQAGRDRVAGVPD